MRSEVKANETRGTGPTFDSWPANLPQIAYVTADSAFLCVTCANGGNGSEASTTSDNEQWRIIGAQTLEQCPRELRVCAHCERYIPSTAADSRI
jgi:hypothetical protein